MPKLKRGRGRPTAEMQQIYAIDAAQAQVKEIFAGRYLDAMRYIADLVVDEKASANIKLTASKIIKEQVEEWLEEHYESMEEEDILPENSPPQKIVI